MDLWFDNIFIKSITPEVEPILIIWVRDPIIVILKHVYLRISDLFVIDFVFLLLWLQGPQAVAKRSQIHIAASYFTRDHVFGMDAFNITPIILLVVFYFEFYVRCRMSKGAFHVTLFLLIVIFLNYFSQPYCHHHGQAVINSDFSTYPLCLHGNGYGAYLSF